MPVTAAQLEWVKPPLQARSAQTMERLLDAAEAIIIDHGIDAATVAEVARRAESSVGSFYARFADKEALVRCLLERFHEQAIATTDAVLVAERWDGIALGDALETMLLFMMRVLRERRRLIVAMLVRAAADPTLGVLGLRLHDHITERLIAVLRRRQEPLDHPDPEIAVRMAAWLVLAAMESRLLYGTADERLPDALVAAELSRMALRYIGTGTGVPLVRQPETRAEPEPKNQSRRARPARAARKTGS
jgi:AcrR family transcriptional regulator